MAGPTTIPIVLIGRYTTFAGQTTYSTVPIEVSAYESIEVFAWRAAMADVNWTFQLSVEESTDLVAWTQVAGGTLLPESETRYAGPISRGWLRAVVDLAGSVGDFPVVTCYLVGQLVRRWG